MKQQEVEIIDLDDWLKRPIPEPVRAEMKRLAGVLKSWRPTLVEFLPERPLPWIELNDEEYGVQFAVHHNTVVINIPYFGERARDIMACATGCFGILNTAAGYVAFDPQLGCLVTSTSVNEMVAHYRGIDRVLPDILANDGHSAAANKKPWWKIW